MDEPAFRWWAPFALEKSNRTLKAVKRRSAKRRKTEKFGLEVPRPNDVRRALCIDEETGTRHRSNALAKEIKTVLPALKIIERDEKVPPGYNYIEKVIIRMALYGLKSAGYSWRSFCARILREELNFIPCRADMDVWRRAARKKNGNRYYEYLFVYTDDIIAISEDPKRILDVMNGHFLLKADSIEEPTRYLVFPHSPFCIGSLSNK